MPSHPRRVRAGLLFGLAFFGAWAAGACDADGGGDVPVTPQRELSVSTNRFAYASGEPVSVTLRMTNRSAAPITLEFSSGQRYDIRFQDEAGETVWSWSADRTFIQMMGEETLEPGESVSYEETFEGELMPGTYTVIGQIVAIDNPLSGSATFVVE